MGSFFLSSEIEVLILPLISRCHLKWDLVLRLILALHLIPHRMDMQPTIQTVDDIFRACVLDLKGNWDYHHSLIDFSYTIVTIQAFTWSFMRNYIGIHIDLH